jgi:ABC-2 type transport system ATP-binding protein
MITFHEVSKSYGDFAAVRRLALAVDKGEVFGFLGPNGAGKTTTIRMMMGILVPSGGRITIDGLDCQADRVQVKRRVGCLPDNPVFYDYLRGREILAFVGEMHGQPRPRLATMVLTALVALALWQKARDRFPFLLDPTAAPPARVSHTV